MKTFEYKTKLNNNGGLVLEPTRTYNTDGRKRYTDPKTVADFIGDEIGLRTAADEYVYIICLDTAGHVLGLFEASHGSANASLFPVREMCKKILMLNAINVIISHNHPSGSTTPSAEDQNATSNIHNALRTVGVGLLDHIIVGGNTAEYYSFNENGLL